MIFCALSLSSFTSLIHLALSLHGYLIPDFHFVFESTDKDPFAVTNGV